MFENLVNHHKNKERRDGVFKISDKELDDLLTLADDRECEKLTRARGYDDTLSMKYLDLRGKDLSGKKFWNVDFSRTDLSDANLNGCVFEFCEFGHTNLSGATMIASRLQSDVLERHWLAWLVALTERGSQMLLMRGVSLSFFVRHLKLG